MLLRRRLTPRRAAFIIGTCTTLITILGGGAVRLVDRRDFHTFGDGLWWALQTVTTVGYGDIVPKNTDGRLVGALIMISGIAFLAVVTASVTATLVETARARLVDGRRELTSELAEEITSRLAAIETRLDELAPGATSDQS